MELYKIFPLFLGTILLLLIGVSMGDPITQRKMLDSILDPNKYDKRIRPFGNGTSGPVNVTINMYLRSIQKIDDVNMNYETQLTFRMEWEDSRLAFSHLMSEDEKKNLHYLTLASSDHPIWIPDLFFSNEIKSHTHVLLKPNTYTRIFPNGSVLYSLRLSLTLSCPMVLKLFPMDMQTCSIRMASYGYTTADILFKWKKDNPVQVTPDLHLPKFRLRQFTTDYCDSHTNTGIYSCLRVDLLFAREFRHYLIQVYIPSILLVAVGYIGMWIKRRHVIGRLLVPLLTFLVMCSGSMYISSTFPIVSYSKSIDIWMGTCIFFLFSAFILSIFTDYSGGKKSPQGEGNQGENEEIEMEPLWKNISGKGLIQRYKQESLGGKIGMIARVLYPLCFLLFVIMYFSAYYFKKSTGPVDEYLGDAHGLTPNEDRPGMITVVAHDD